jgi:hypothetical protein
MARYKWTHDGADLIRSEPREGAMLLAIGEPRSPRREHVHVHVHAAKVTDQAVPTAGLRVRAPRPAPKHHAPPFA